MDDDLSHVSINWGAGESQQFEFVIAIIYAIMTILHACIINQNE